MHLNLHMHLNHHMHLHLCMHLHLHLSAVAAGGLWGGAQQQGAGETGEAGWGLWGDGQVATFRSNHLLTDPV